jgi:hypothetical protein
VAKRGVIFRKILNRIGEGGKTAVLSAISHSSSLDEHLFIR